MKRRSFLKGMAAAGALITLPLPSVATTRWRDLISKPTPEQVVGRVMSRMGYVRAENKYVSYGCWDLVKPDGNKFRWYWTSAGNNMHVLCLDYILNLALPNQHLNVASIVYQTPDQLVRYLEDDLDVVLRKAVVVYEGVDDGIRSVINLVINYVDNKAIQQELTLPTYKPGFSPSGIPLVRYFGGSRSLNKLTFLQWRDPRGRRPQLDKLNNWIGEQIA
jgi:hypothetical protein